MIKFSDQCEISLGMRQIEACYAMGNAAKEYSNEKMKFLNYLEKGVDLAFDL